MEEEELDTKDEITAEAIVIEQGLNPEEDKYDEDEQDMDFGLADFRNAQKQQ